MLTGTIEDVVTAEKGVFSGEAADGFSRERVLRERVGCPDLRQEE